MLLPVLMAGRWPLTAKFTAFLGTTGQERLSKDSWSTLIAFQKALPNEGALGSWVDDGSWPVLMDEFVEYLNGGGSAAGAAGASGAS